MRKIKATAVLLIILILASVFSGCFTKNVSKFYFDDNIKKSIRDDIADIDDQIYKAIFDGDFESVKEHFSGALLDTGYDFQNSFKQMAYELQDDEKIKHQDVYMKIAYEEETEAIAVQDFKDKAGVTYTFSGYRHEMYISTYVFKSIKGESLVYFEYVKDNGKWQLYRLIAGTLSIHEMNAYDIYQKANELNEKGYDIPAALYTNVYKICAQPCEYIQYIKATEMNTFFNELISDVNTKYNFPIALDANAGKEIYAFDINIVNEGIIPTIIYITDSELGDSNKEALQQEASSIHEEIKGIFNGYDESFDYFVYKAFNDYPNDASKEYYSYSSIVIKE